MTKNIKVTDDNGNVLGYTYPKRAKGLIKNGRARYVDDCTISLSVSSPDNKSEAKKQMNYILLNPRDWSEKDGVELSFIDGLENKLEEVVTIYADETGCFAESRHYLLEPDAENSFVFWLKCDDATSPSKACDLLVNFNTEEPTFNRYKLCRNLIKPGLDYKGWKLFSIGFNTPKAEGKVDVNFSFTVKGLDVVLMSAKEPDYYNDWKEEKETKEPLKKDVLITYDWGKEDGDSSKKGGFSSAISFIKGLRHLTDNITVELQDPSPIHKENDSPEVEQLKDELEYDLDAISDSYDELNDNLSDYEERFDELKDRMKEVTLSSDEYEYVSDILTSLDIARQGLSKVVIKDLTDMLREVNCEEDGDRFQETTDKAQEILDDVESELDDVDDLLNNLEDAIEELEDSDQ